MYINQHSLRYKTRSIWWEFSQLPGGLGCIILVSSQSSGGRIDWMAAVRAGLMKPLWFAGGAVRVRLFLTMRTAYKTSYFCTRIRVRMSFLVPYDASVYRFLWNRGVLLYSACIQIFAYKSFGCVDFHAKQRGTVLGCCTCTSKNAQNRILTSDDFSTDVPPISMECLRIYMYYRELRHVLSHIRNTTSQYFIRSALRMWYLS